MKGRDAMTAKFSLLAAATAFAIATVAAPVFADSGPNDAQIAHIAYTAGALDVAAAKQALALVKKLGVTPEDNATSAALSKQAAETHDRLDKLSGAAFDQAYAKNEVAYHQAVNSALKGTLIPSADNAELKSLLEAGLTLFTEHQHHAEHLAAEL
jgi:putative membrane protein